MMQYRLGRGVRRPIKQINPHRAPLFSVEHLDAYLALQPVQDYLAALDDLLVEHALTIDYALGIGIVAVQETRAGRLDEHLALGAQSFGDRDEFADLVAAVLVYLAPLIGMHVIPAGD